MVVLLWLQFTYALWQFVREAKFFRVPSAFIYHTYKWLRDPSTFGPPFSTVTFSLVVQGQKWTFPDVPAQNQLQPGDISVGTSTGTSSHFIQRRNGTRYLVDYESLAYSFILHNRGTRFLCSSVDNLLPGLCIADVYDWGEGFDHFMAEGATDRPLTIKRLLLMSSREHFLNKDFTRLISILPLMLRAKGHRTASTVVSIAIIILDQLSYPANQLWNAVKDSLVMWTRFCISRIPSYNRRNAVATFLSTVSPRLMFRDEIFRNFYYVREGDRVLLFGTSCLDHFYEDVSAVVELVEPPVSELNPFHNLADEFNGLNKGLLGGVSIPIGTPFVEHQIAGSRIKTFFIQTGFYNFIDNRELHYGVFENDSEQHRIRIALKWIEQNGRMPVTCNHRGELCAVKFNMFVDKVAKGNGVVTGRVKKGSWVQ